MTRRTFFAACAGVVGGLLSKAALFSPTDKKDAAQSKHLEAGGLWFGLRPLVLSAHDIEPVAGDEPALCSCAAVAKLLPTYCSKSSGSHRVEVVHQGDGAEWGAFWSSAFSHRAQKPLWLMLGDGHRSFLYAPLNAVVVGMAEPVGSLILVLGFEYA